jgi:hypothetical protein
MTGAEVLAATRLLPGRWFAQFDHSPAGKSYARLGRTGSDASMMVLLIKRQDSPVVLTDCLSDQTHSLVTRYHSVTKAMRIVFATVLATGDKLA